MEKEQKEDNGRQWLTRTERNLNAYYRGAYGLEKSREDALGDWVGEERTAEVFSELRPLHTDMSGLIDRVLSRIDGGDALMLSKLQESWTELFGPMIASQCSPLSINDGHLVIEVNNATMMYVFERQKKAEFLAHVQTFTGGKLTSIEFVPRGRRSWRH